MTADDTGAPAPGDDADQPLPPPEHNAARQRTTRRIALGSALAGLGLALLSGVGGADGRTGFVILLLVSTLGVGIAALHATLTLLVDDLRGRPTSRRRAVTAVGLFVGAAALMAMVAGAGG